MAELIKNVIFIEQDSNDCSADTTCTKLSVLRDHVFFFFLKINSLSSFISSFSLLYYLA